MSKFRIHHISGVGLPPRFDVEYDSAEEAAKVAIAHHDGKFEIVAVPGGTPVEPEPKTPGPEPHPDLVNDLPAELEDDDQDEDEGGDEE